MAKFKVLKKFRDIHTKKVYNPNTEIEMTLERADEVVKNLDGSFLERIDEEVTESEETSEDEGFNAEDMTIQQLKDVLDQLGVEYKSNAKKDELISLLENVKEETDKKE